MRVQIPAYTDRFMMGDRYGEVIGVSVIRPLGKTSKSPGVITYNVKLDKSGKMIRFVADDCTEVL